MASVEAMAKSLRTQANRWMVVSLLLRSLLSSLVVELVKCREHSLKRDFQHGVEIGGGGREGLVHCLCDVVNETPFSVSAVHVVAYVLHYAVVDVEQAGKEGDDERAEGEGFRHAFSGDDKGWVVD